MHGRGKMYYSSGEYYEGYWSLNQANGRGRIFHLDGGVYVIEYLFNIFQDGNWINGKANGKGKYIALDDSYYDGDWKDDL